MTYLVSHAQGGALVRAGRAGSVTPAPPPQVPAGVTIFGINTNENPKDGPNQRLAGRQAWFNGRAPMVRRYNSTFLDSGNWPITTAVAPEKRVSYSFKADDTGTYTKAGLAAGNGNARLTAMCNDIPAGWDVVLTYYHEVNDDIRKGGMTIAQFRDAYDQFRTAIDAATLRTGTRVRLASNFMAYQVANTPAYFDDSWVPPVGVADLMTWDVYGNPGHFTSQRTGPGYGTTYPNVVTRFRDVWAATERNGFAAKWGIQELNTPARDWDTSETARRDWLVEATEHCLAPPMTGSKPPEVFLYWEAITGVNWNQAFGRVSGNALTCANAIKPYITGTPTGG